MPNKLNRRWILGMAEKCNGLEGNATIWNDLN
jgi:hypothetical protein